MKKLILLLVIFIQFSAQAYIPRFWMILSRTAENHGNGLYQVIQNVTFLHQAEPILLRESWLIRDGEHFRVTVTGLGSLKEKVEFTRIYDGDKVYYLGEGKKVRYHKLSDDWFESYFNFRYSAKIKPRMFAQKMISAEGLSLPPAYRPAKKGEERVLEYETDFLRLGRSNGKVAYAIGTPAPVGATQLPAGMWIEQDQFNVLKIRLKTQTEVTARNYGKFSRNLNIARVREVSWGDQKAEIHTMSVKPLYVSSANKKLLSYQSLSEIKEEQKPLRKEDDSVIYDFYSRFR
ncbi:MAG: hypothetical protein KDD61_12165 [Bdellovibrionales bacterium]|nr:hypothetical protein [Bdellovibrionales bacterium]